MPLDVFFYTPRKHQKTRDVVVFPESIGDALRDFGSNAYKRRSNGWPKRRSN